MKLTNVFRELDDVTLSEAARKADDGTLAVALRQLPTSALLDVLRSAAESEEEAARPAEPPKERPKPILPSARARLTEAEMSDLVEHIRRIFRERTGALTLDGIASAIDATGAMSKSSIRTALERLIKLKLVEPIGSRRNRWYRWLESKDAAAE